MGNDNALPTNGNLTVNGGDFASDAARNIVNPLVVTSITGGITGDNDLTFTGGASGSGTLVVKGNATAKIAGADDSFAPTAIQVNNGGTLLLGGSNVIGATAINLNGGTFKTGGNSDSVGALTLSGSSTIDFSGSKTGDMTFTTTAWSSGGFLTINNWDDTYGGGGNTHLVFTGAIGDGFLNNVQFSGYGVGANAISYGGSVELAPIPEPVTIIGALAFLGLIVLRERRRIVSLWKKTGVSQGKA